MTLRSARFPVTAAENVTNGAVGAFHGQNGANGNEETVTIRPGGNAEVRTRGEAPR